MLELFLVFLSALLVRLAPAPKSRVEHDVYGHLYYAKALKEQGGAPWSGIYTKAWNSPMFYHPFLWHWIVGFLSIDFILRKGHAWINAVVDAIFSLAVYLILPLFGLSNEEAVLGFFLYLLSPLSFTRFSIGPRVNSFTPRLISEILVNLYFVLLALDLNPTPSVTMIATSIIALLVLLSSKFGLQALLFISVFFALIEGQLNSFIPLVTGLALATLISRGAVINFLNAQVLHLAMYFRRNIKGEMAVSQRNKMMLAIKSYRAGEISSKDLLAHLLISNCYTGILLKFPVFFLLLLMLLFLPIFGKSYDSIANELPIVQAAALVYLITSLSPFLFLGEAERYLSHVSILIVVSSIVLMSSLGLTSLLWMLVAYGAIFYVVELYYVYVNRSYSEGEAEEADVMNFLLNLSSKCTIILYPYHAIGVYKIMLETKHEVIFPYFLEDAERTRFAREFESCYPYINLSRIEEIVKSTGANVIIADKRRKSNNGYSAWTPPEGWRKIELNQKFYDVYISDTPSH